jgi:hypothetical protein
MLCAWSSQYSGLAQGQCSPAFRKMIAETQTLNTESLRQPAGSTPSLIKLKPGAHSVKVTKKGYMLWVRSINTDAGESRNLAADLDKISP